MSGRGRGRRAKDTSTKSSTNSETENPGSVASSTVGRKPRKKQFPVVATVTNDGIDGSLQGITARKPLIAHLPIQSRNVMFHDEPVKYDPQPPTEVKPFGSFIDNPFFEQSEDIGSAPVADVSVSVPEPIANVPISKVQAIEPGSIDYYRKGELLIQYKGIDEIRKIPEKSDAACFWCCHTFTNRPCVLPLNDHGEYLSVFGNFCSPECTMSYLFDSHQDSHMRWEQLALLNRVYADSVGGRINPAPPRTVLKLFGGMYSIEEYRSLINKKMGRVDIHLPPMVSILATMDTKPIDFYDVSLTKNVMETVKERLNKAEAVLKLRRTKPLKAWESTLDACINLKVMS